ncbi:MAG: type I methionyl aminopeptidase [Phycisphaerales bacterium JB059]
MPRIPKLNDAEAEHAAVSAQKVVSVHQRLADFLRVGLTLAQIDSFVAQTLDDLGAKSCFKGYRAGRLPPFPSHACLSVNDCVVHGTAGYYEQPLQPGDLLSVDVGVAFRGWMGDAAWTYSFGEPGEDARRLMDAGKDSLREGIKQLHPDNTYLEWAKTVQRIVEGERGLHLIRGLGGHGYGRKLHAPPFISNIVPRSPLEWPEANKRCEPGTLVAVEPMIALTTGETEQAHGKWPIFSADGSLSVHYEHDVLITESGPRVLTAGLEQIQDVIER